MPLINIGRIGPNPADTANLNVLETYQVSADPRRSPHRARARRSRNARRQLEHVQEAGRSHRRQVDPELRAVRRQPHLRRQDPGLRSNGRALRRPAARGLRREPGRGVRPDQPESARPGGRHRERARRQERHEPRARSADRLPDQRQRPGDRRVDDGQRARCRADGRRRRKLAPGLAARASARERAGDRAARTRTSSTRASRRTTRSSAPT